METFRDDHLESLLVWNLQHTEGKYIIWLTIADQQQSVVDDVTRIRQHPLVPGDVSIYGFIFDVKTGKQLEVVEA